MSSFARHIIARQTAEPTYIDETRDTRYEIRDACHACDAFTKQWKFTSNSKAPLLCKQMNAVLPFLIRLTCHDSHSHLELPFQISDVSHLPQHQTPH